MFCYAKNKLHSVIYNECDIHEIYKVAQSGGNVTAIFNNPQELSRICPQILLTTGEIVKEEIGKKNLLDICTTASQVAINLTNSTLYLHNYSHSNLKYSGAELTDKHYVYRYDCSDMYYNDDVSYYLIPAFYCTISVMLGLLARPYFDKFINLVQSYFSDNKQFTGDEYHDIVGKGIDDNLIGVVGEHD